MNARDFADLGVGLYDRKQAFTIQLAHFARFAHLRPQQGTAPGEHVNFARELARAMHCHEFFARSRWANDLDLARDDDEERCSRITGLEEDLSALRGPPVPMRYHPRQLRGCEPGEHPLSWRFPAQRNLRCTCRHLGLHLQEITIVTH
jgi:hypothetical protein